MTKANTSIQPTANMSFVLAEFFVFMCVVLGCLANKDITVNCSSDSVLVTWNVTSLSVDGPSRLYLGECLPSSFSSSADGAIATFHYYFQDCDFNRVVTATRMQYRNRLTYRPLPLPNESSFSHIIVCSYQRPDIWKHPSYTSVSANVSGHGNLIFYMGVLNEDLTGPAWTTTFTLGSFISIWAAVDQEAHWPLTVFFEECVATDRPEVSLSRKVYPIVTNGGCLVDGKVGQSRFEPRVRTSEILLSLQTFKFDIGDDIYIQCTLVAWDPELLNERKKACNYIKELEEWELLDDPTASDLCKCCDTRCGPKWEAHQDSQGQSKTAVVGPLKFVDEN